MFAMTDDFKFNPSNATVCEDALWTIRRAFLQKKTIPVPDCVRLAIYAYPYDTVEIAIYCEAARELLKEEIARDPAAIDAERLKYFKRLEDYIDFCRRNPSYDLAVE